MQEHTEASSIVVLMYMGNKVFEMQGQGVI